MQKMMKNQSRCALCAVEAAHQAGESPSEEAMGQALKTRNPVVAAWLEAGRSDVELVR